MARTVWFFSVVIPAAVIGVCVFVSSATESVLSHTGPATCAALTFGSVCFIFSVLASEESLGSDHAKRLVRGIATTLGGLVLLLFITLDKWPAFPTVEAALAAAGPFLALLALWVAWRFVATGGLHRAERLPLTRSRTAAFQYRLDPVLSHPLGDAFWNSIRLILRLALVFILFIVARVWIPADFVWNAALILSVILLLTLSGSKFLVNSVRALRVLPVSRLRLVVWFLLYPAVELSLAATIVAVVCLSGQLGVSWSWIAVVDVTILLIGFCHLASAYALGKGDPVDVDVGCLTALGLIPALLVAAGLTLSSFAWITDSAWGVAWLTGISLTVAAAIWIGWLLRHSSAPFEQQKEQ